MDYRVQINNITAIHTIVESAQLSLQAVFDQRRLDLIGAELGVGEHGQVGGEGAQDAVAAEEQDAVLVEFHGADEDVDGGFGLILEDVALVLGEGRLVVVAGGRAGVTYNGQSVGGRGEETEREGELGEDLHGGFSESTMALV